jgi:hypothetical protein
MNHCYSDILSRIKEPPLWFDENAVPRWCKFEPSKLANIYAREAALGVVRCQACHHEFHVVISCTRYEQQLSSLVANRQLHYGDPPNIGCCDVGLSMNSEFLRVLEFWSRPNFDWIRVPEFEGVGYDI